MLLKDLLKNISSVAVEGDLEKKVSGLALDSRKVKDGFLFFAVSGTKLDGHDFIDTALTFGASVIVCEKIPENTHAGVTYVKVANVRDIVANIAAEFFGHPSKKIAVVGVTGTNGKTTIATMLYKLFSELGQKSGLISTIENKIGDEIIPTIHTTPDAVSLQELFAKMVEAECKYVFMEVSSHAIDQGRTKEIDFRGGVFTNLTQDHLDYHQTMEEYANAKKKFFDILSTESFALTNIDDRYGEFMVKDSKAKHVTYAEGKGDLDFQIINSSAEGLTLMIGDTEIKSPLLGKFNAYNLVAIFGVAALLEFSKEKIKEVLEKLTGARGRMEKVLGKSGIIGLVDYSHTPDALKNALETINGFKGAAKVITVFGAGGDRDKTKRPIMGKIAAELSDHVIVTSDNPRSEDPNQIIEEILAGIPKTQGRTLRVSDRKEAIEKAVEMAKPGDIVLVAGKGHEDYQEVMGVKTHFSDIEVLKQIL